MASLLTHTTGEKIGKRYIVFHRGGKRKMIYLGGGPRGAAETVKLRVEYLLGAVMSGAPIDPDTAYWVSKIDDELHAKLAKVGLIEPRKSAKADAVALDAFCTAHIADLKVKPGTRFNLDLARRNLVEFFGANKPLADITPGCADDWRRWLSRPEKKGVPVKQSGKGLSANTVRRRCGRAKQFFRAAVRKRLIPESPFGDMKDTRVGGNGERFFFVSQEDADKVLAKCPDTQWRLLFALCRYAGLRCPSEPAGLKWSEVDLERGRFTVHSPKTEHFEGHESREVPIFPELRPYLEAAKAEATKGEKYVVTIPSVAVFRRGGPSPNLGTRMHKIIKRAGLAVWPKLFHNLRATRQTELVAAGHPEHVVSQWLGNTQAIAREHYLRVTDADFDRATLPPPSRASRRASQDAPQEARGADFGMRQGITTEVDQSRLLLKTVQKALENDGVDHVASILVKAIKEYELTPTGLEPVLPP